MARHFLADPTVLKAPTVTVRGGQFVTANGDGRLTVSDERQYIGRGPECALVLDDPTVSALHAEVQATPEGVRVVDLGSKNGTFIEDLRIRDAFLNAPRELRVGDVVLRFAPAAPEQVELSGDSRFGPLIGTTPEMLALFARLRRIAASDLSILITGETGTGKELVARAVHGASNRRSAPFVAVNCAAVADTLLEAELFGHEKGAFTGADRARPGYFVEADGGTLFLDEVAEMSPAMQAALLRVLQEGEVRAVGSTRARKVNVRTLFATHVDLKEAVNRGRFRADLYFRIAKFTVELPPLRDRAQDIPFLVRRILDDLGEPDKTVDDHGMRLLQARDWRGNVRELRNVIEVALVASDGNTLSLDEALPLAQVNPRASPETQSERDAVKEFLHYYYKRLHAACRGNITQIAKRAGKGRDAVRNTMRQVGIDIDDDTRA